MEPITCLRLKSTPKGAISGNHDGSTKQLTDRHEGYKEVTHLTSNFLDLLLHLRTKSFYF